MRCMRNICAIAGLAGMAALPLTAQAQGIPEVGDISDLIIDNNGTVTTAIVGVGGLLGAGQKEIAVPFKELKVSSRDGKDWLVINMTKDELMKAPAYENESGK